MLRPALNVTDLLTARLASARPHAAAVATEG